MSNGWNDEELAASVEAYRAMAEMEAAGQRYNKAQIYRDLGEKFGRSAKAFEYRMQNISALYDELGMPWIQGLKPAVNVGADMKPRLMRLIQQAPSAPQQGQFKHGDKRTWELALDAIAALNDSAGRLEVRDWLWANYPTYNENNLVDLEMLSVNSPSRTSYGQNAAPRKTNTGSIYDRLFKVGNGSTARFEPYSPEVHGIWEIYPDPNSGNRNGMSIRRVDDPIAAGLAKATEELESAGAFSPRNVEDARHKVLAEIVRRQGQPGFRKALLSAYDNACAITGCPLFSVLEAAHVHPYKGAHTNVTSNGLLLRTDIHTLFDLYLIAIDSATMTVLVSPELTGTEYAELAGKPIRIPPRPVDRVSIEALDWHRSRCSW